jgi:hypothetical protein
MLSFKPAFSLSSHFHQGRGKKKKKKTRERVQNGQWLKDKERGKAVEKGTKGKFQTGVGTSGETYTPPS